MFTANYMRDADMDIVCSVRAIETFCFARAWPGPKLWDVKMNRKVFDPGHVNQSCKVQLSLFHR